MTDREKGRRTQGHPEEGRLLAHLDGELTGTDAARLAEHLEACGTCRRRRGELAAASETLGRELRGGDVEVPTLDALSIRRAARARSAAGEGARPREAREPGRSAFWKAAVLVLGVGAAASATVPGSPVQGWISDAVRALAASFSGGEAPAEPAGEARPAAASQGVSVSVAGGAVVRITDPAPGLTVRVRSVDDSLLTVVARGARYRAAEGEVEVVGADVPDLRIDLPASATPVRVSSAGVLLLERTEGRLRVHAARADTTDGEISFSVEGTSD